MNRTENDLHDALQTLAQRADQAGVPSTASIVDGARRRASNGSFGRAAASVSWGRWLPPLAAAVAVGAVTIGIGVAVHSDDQHAGDQRASSGAARLSNGGRPALGVQDSHGSRTDSGSTATPLRVLPPPSTTAPMSSAATPSTPTASPSGGPSSTAPTTAPAPPPQAIDAAPADGVLDAAAALLVAQRWTAPAADRYFYVRTTQATTWTAVSGTRAGRGRASDGTATGVPGCRGGRFVGGGQAGSCTLDDVGHYRADAPTTADRWDAYLEALAPGAKAADAQGKIIVQVLHQDLLAPAATAALLRYTETCRGLHTVDVAPVAGRKLIGVTCASMTNGSYALVFDARSHAYVGFVGVDPDGRADAAAEVILQTGVVSAIGHRP